MEMSISMRAAAHRLFVLSEDCIGWRSANEFARERVWSSPVVSGGDCAVIMSNLPLLQFRSLWDEAAWGCEIKGFADQNTIIPLQLTSHLPGVKYQLPGFPICPQQIENHCFEDESWQWSCNTGVYTVRQGGQTDYFAYTPNTNGPLSVKNWSQHLSVSTAFYLRTCFLRLEFKSNESDAKGVVTFKIGSITVQAESWFCCRVRPSILGTRT